ncbi:hypothetical protein RIF29_29130 [Crotalaria pallida]|uniref:Uncharacterized protein n=1 Tax=Crotalaria pallida TaxID=3830 RepID=A0AAN9EE87_CROPI
MDRWLRDYNGGYPLPLPARIDPGAEEVDVYEDLDSIEPLENGFEAWPQSDPDDIEEDSSEGLTPTEYSDADIWEYDPKKVPAAASSDEEQ